MSSVAMLWHVIGIVRVHIYDSIMVLVNPLRNTYERPSDLRFLVVEPSKIIFLV